MLEPHIYLTLRSFSRFIYMINEKFPQILIETEYLILSKRISQLNHMEIAVVVQDLEDYFNSFWKENEMPNYLYTPSIKPVLN